MQKKGFAFLETIMATIILTSSLLLLYGTFKRIIQTVNNNIYYDDVNFIYRSEYLKDLLYKNEYKDTLNNNQGFLMIDKEEYNSAFEKQIWQDFEIESVILFKKDKLKEMKNCLYSNSCNFTISKDFATYLKKINIDIDSEIVMAFNYQTCVNNNCHNYYSWVSV